MTTDVKEFVQIVIDSCLNEDRAPYIQNSTVEEIKRIIEMIPTPEGVLEFLEKFAEKLGTGSSRQVFDTAPDKVLKIAFNKAGLSQNLVELSFSKHLGDIVPKFYDSHPEGYWIEMEKVEPLLKPNGQNATLDADNMTLKEVDMSSMLNTLSEFVKYNFSDLETYFEDSEARVDSLYEEYEILQSKIEELEGNLRTTSDINDRYEILESIKGLENRQIEVMENSGYSEFDDVLRFHHYRDNLGLSIENIERLAFIIQELRDHGIGDYHIGNLGINSSGEFVVLDFGFHDSNADLYGFNQKRTNFSKEDYFDSTSHMSPAHGNRHESMMKEVIESVIKETVENFLLEFWGNENIQSFIFKSLKRLDQEGADFDQYLDLLSTLPRIGTGSSRMVFALDDDIAIKLQKDDSDIQNEHEADPFLQTLFGTFVTKVFDAGEDYRWIASERATPVSNRSQEEKWLRKVGLGELVDRNLSVYDLSVLLNDFHQLYSKIEKEMGKEALSDVSSEKIFKHALSNMKRASSSKEVSWNFTLDDLKRWSENPIISLLSRASRNNGVAIGDIGLGNIGFGSDGRPVILDLGLSNDIYEEDGY